MNIEDIQTKNWTVRYGIAVGLAVLAIIARYALAPLMLGKPYQTLYPAILLAAIVAGSKPAILTAILGYPILLYLYGTLRIFPAVSGLATVILTASLAGFLTQRLHDALALSRQSEERQRKLAAKLSDRNEEIQNLARIIRHDFGNILFGIRVSSTMIEETCDRIIRGIENLEQPEVKKLLESFNQIKEDIGQIHLENGHMSDMLAALKRMSDIDKPALELRTVDMDSLLDDVLNILKPQIAEANVKIERSSLASCTADKDQMRHVLLNLMSNAVKYLDPQRHGIIKIGGESEKNENIYWVSDNGIGIEPQNIGKLFRMFERFVPSDFAPGDGIGLAMVKRIIEKHDGRIWAQSKPTEGTTFFFAVPNKSTQ